MFFASAQSASFTDEDFGYAVSFPQHWVREKIHADQHIFYDTSGSYRSQLAIIRYPFSRSEYSSSRYWIYISYLAYRIAGEHSSDPAGIILYSDSSSSVRQGPLWAVEFYSRFFSMKAQLGWWSEYVRFTASDTVGYELYAIGDTADMAANVAFYAALLQSFRLPDERNASVRPPLFFPAGGARTGRSVSAMVDLRGKALRKVDGRIPSGIYLIRPGDELPERRGLSGGIRVK